uniref:Uncharacterized protein n=1 Tax=Plectus sambesii TaxID=2011161 RepID=A0A914WMG4_9BILA
MRSCSGNLYMNKRAGKGEAYEPTCHEQLANTASHGIAIIPSLIALRWMIDASHRDLQHAISWVFGIFTTILFLTSTLYHGCEWMFRPKFSKLRYYLHIIDRAAIYFFIAASYTPWLMLRDCGPTGANLKWSIWLFAILGIVYQYNFHERYKSLETFLYVVIAAGPAFAIFTIQDRSGLPIMLAGGLVYMLGVVFFKMDGIIPFAHAIWHCHVLVGAFLQYVAVYTALLGPDKNNPFPDLSAPGVPIVS